MTHERRPGQVRSALVVVTVVALAVFTGSAGAGIAQSAPRATGTVEIVWPGGNGMQGPDVAKRAFVEVEWFDLDDAKPDRGQFRYLVRNPDGSPHREIIATVTDDTRSGVYVDQTNAKAMFVGEVISDIRVCSGHSDGGTDTGGCTGHDTGDTGGCGGGGGSSDTDGCTGETDTGGCTGHDTGDTGGCTSGTDTDGCTGHDTGDTGGCTGGGGSGGSGGVSGKESRVGQFIVVKLHDGGSPGRENDGITWKWFSGDRLSTEIPWSIHLCKKTVIGGNLVVH